jgi:preprotein translocase subunit SecA
MINTLLAKVIGTQNERELKRLRPQVARINELESSVRDLSEAELRGKTVVLRERVTKGESLDDVLPEAAVCARSAACSACGTSTCNSSAAWCYGGRSR